MTFFENDQPAAKQEISVVMVAALVVLLAKAYLAVGLCVGAAFILFGIERLDPSARGAYAFRPLLLPGLTILWPLVLRRWLAAGRTVAGDH